VLAGPEQWCVTFEGSHDADSTAATRRAARNWVMVLQFPRLTS